MRALILAVLVGAFLLQAADTLTVRPVTLVVGKGELLQFDREIDRVVIAEPKIADAIIVSQHDVMVNAKGAGQTTLVIWEKGAAPTRYDVTILSDKADLITMRQSLEAEL